MIAYVIVAVVVNAALIGGVNVTVVVTSDVTDNPTVHVTGVADNVKCLPFLELLI